MMLSRPAPKRFLVRVLQTFAHYWLQAQRAIWEASPRVTPLDSPLMFKPLEEGKYTAKHIVMPAREAFGKMFRFKHASKFYYGTSYILRQLMRQTIWIARLC